MLQWIKQFFRKPPETSAAEMNGEPPNVHPVMASQYELHDIGEAVWDASHNRDLLSVLNDGNTIEWDKIEYNTGGLAPCWVPASTRLHLHSGEFALDYAIENMGDRQIGVGFLIVLTDGQKTGEDWGFFGYLGSSNTAWAYDPSTGDVVTATESIECGLPQFDRGGSGVVRLHLSLPRHDVGYAIFSVNGIESKPIPLPLGAVVLPAACFLKIGQRITLANFNCTLKGCKEKGGT